MQTLMLKKCIKLVYNNIRKKEDLPLSVIWASIMNEEDISKIRSRLRGILTMEQIDRLSKRIEDVNDDEKVIKEWMIEENSKWYFEELKEDGFQEGMEKGIETTTTNMIKNLLKQNVDYNIISNASGKTIEEIKEIEETIKQFLLFIICKTLIFLKKYSKINQQDVKDRCI